MATLSLFNITDQTAAVTDSYEFNGKWPEYSGLMNDPKMTLCLAKLSKGSIIVVNLNTGKGEKFTGDASVKAFGKFALDFIAGAGGWEEVSRHNLGKGYSLYQRKAG